MSNGGRDDGMDTEDQQRILRTLWEPHPGQRAIMDHPARYRIVACGRRWGKSEMCAHLGLQRALEHSASTVWWCGPTYDDANDYGFAKMRPLLSPEILADEPKRTKPRALELRNGSEISFRSAEREDSLRGGGVDFLIIDESASVPERAWTAELRPTLSDSQGEMIAIGTPKGRNWFYRWFKRGQSEDYPEVASFQAPTYQNPHIADTEITAARDDMPDRVFEQEYLAKFVDDASGVFQNIRERNVESYSLPVSPSKCGGPYAIGVDFARVEDWTVIVVLDADGRIVAFERLQQTTWTRIQQSVERLADTYTPSAIALDATRDNKIVQDLEDRGYFVDSIRFSPANKRTLIENLITELEAGRITIPESVNTLVNELEVYESQTNDRGRVRYTAPSGFHDDCVDALALAVSAEDPTPRTIPSTF